MVDWSRSTVSAALCPSKVQDLEDPLLVKLAKLLDSSLPSQLRVVLSDYQALVERIVNTPLATGQWETNPLLSAPHVVSQMSKHQKLDEDAAVLYLQMLTLLEPSKKNVEEWNGWTSARYAAAAKQLLDRKLVINGKRPKTGREIFLPTGWEQVGHSKSSIETWKASLYGLVRQGKPAVLSSPLGQTLVPLQPYHLLFATAYERVTSGDPPAYERTK